MAQTDVAQQFMAKVAELQKPMNSVIDRGDSDIQRFYWDSVVFVTGGSGFLGKLLIEKLFRSCNIKKIYLLMRGKKNKTIQERLDAILKDSLFDTVREKKPQFSEQIVPIEGEVSYLRLGISPQEWETLTQEAEVIFHVAASTRFDESLPQATLANVRGTREVLTLARECSKLRSVVHMSTAFCHATEDRIGTKIREQLYPCPVPPDALIGMAETMREGRLNSIASGLIGEWPNTYLFTKAVAEEALRMWGQGLPIAIVRPPVVLSAYYEPTPGWTDMNCVFGPSGLLLGLGYGAIHVSWNNDMNIAFAPGDYVTNATIAVGCETARRMVYGRNDIQIYTISNNKCGYTWGDAGKVYRDPANKKYASPKSLWYGWSIETGSKWVYWLLTWILHYIPAYFLDLVFSVVYPQRSKELPPSFVNLYRKYYKMSLVFGHFLTKKWYMRNDNTSHLFSNMSSLDQTIFNFEMKSINWDDYVLVWGLGLRKYIVKDGLKGSDYGEKKQKWFMIANFVFFIVYSYLMLKLFSFVWSVVSNLML